MKEEHINLIIKFYGKLTKYIKKYKVRIQAKYHFPTDDFPEMGWMLYADWIDKNKKHKYTAILLKD